MTVHNLVPGDMSNYTCKSRNIAGHHELNGSIYVNCETFLFTFNRNNTCLRLLHNCFVSISW